MLTGSGRLGFLTTLTLAAALSVVGCGAGSSTTPKALPPLAATTTPKPTSPPLPPPSTPKPTTKAAELAAATAVVRRYYQVLNGLHTDMNAAGFSAIFTSDCGCRAQVRAIRSAKAKGEHYIDQVHLIKLTGNLDGNSTADVLVSFRASRGGLVDAHNHQLTSAPAQRLVHRDFVLVMSDHKWLISELDVV